MTPHPNDDERERPNEPLRPEATPVICPDADCRTDTRPKPLGLALPTPLRPPVVREEKMVGRATG